MGNTTFTIKLKAVKTYLKKNQSLRTVAQQMGIPFTTLRFWVQLYKKGGEERLRMSRRPKKKITEDVEKQVMLIKEKNPALSIERARVLRIPDDFQDIVEKEKPDLMYLALGKTYLMALDDWDKDLPCKTIAFTESSSKEVITLPADHIAVQEAAHLGLGPMHGVVGYKGDLLLLTTRFVKNQKNPEKALLELLETPNDIVQMIDMLRKID